MIEESQNNTIEEQNQPPKSDDTSVPTGNNVEETESSAEQSTPSEPKPNEKGDQKEGKGGKKKLLLVAAAIALVIILILAFSSPKYESIHVEYEGETSQGTVLDTNNNGFVVTGATKNGKEKNIRISKCTIEEPATLEADKGASVVVKYKELSDTVDVFCTDSRVLSLKVEYSGPQEEGTVIDIGSDGLVVNAHYVNQSELPITSECKIENGPIILERDTTSEIKVSYVDPVNDKTVSQTIKVKCSTITLKSISAVYSGPTEEGTVLDSGNKGIEVTGLYKDGTKASLQGWVIATPKTLAKDGKETVKIEYTDPVNGNKLDTTLTVKCSTRTVTDLEIEYSGYTSEGTVLDENNSGFTVNAVYLDGEKEKVSGWKIDEAKTLEADKTATVTISYKDASTDYSVECSTISEAKYKSMCTYVSYSDLARNASDYKGKKIAISGKVIQVISEGKGYWLNNEYLLSTGGDIFHVSYYGVLKSRIIEGDYVTVYGTGDGLFSYTTVMNASKTVPDINAKYFN